MRIRVIMDKRDIKKDKNIKRFLSELDRLYTLLKKSKVKKISRYISKTEDEQKVLLNFSKSFCRKLLFELSIINPNKIEIYKDKDKISYRGLEEVLLN